MHVAGILQNTPITNITMPVLIYRKYDGDVMFINLFSARFFTFPRTGILFADWVILFSPDVFIERECQPIRQ